MADEHAIAAVWPSQVPEGSMTLLRTEAHFLHQSELFTARPDASALGYDHAEVVHMAIRMTRSIGMLLLGIWLILTGVAPFIDLPIPTTVMAVLALVAGVLLLVGM